jgi:AP-3 complex subunit delta-1
MLSHSQPNIRKRSVLAMYKLMLRYPEVFQLGLERLKEKLEDPDLGMSPLFLFLKHYSHFHPGVVAATVNVICEIARRHPEDILSLAPPLFHLLTTSPNNWMLIKIVKLVCECGFSMSAHLMVLKSSVWIDVSV